jgi:1-acyl-sn-glycerol-3-phosphate acyltransferase
MKRLNSVPHRPSTEPPSLELSLTTRGLAATNRIRGAAFTLTGNAADRDCPDRPNWVWRFLRFLLRLAIPFWLRYRARGIERIPSSGAALLVINHQSFLDPLLVGAPLRRPISFVARDSLFGVPIVGWILRNMYVIPINRESASAASLRRAADRLKQGFLVGIFPEGTRSPNGRLGPLKPGFLALVRRANVPIIPVGISGSAAALPRNAWFVRPKPCRVVFGEPIPAETVAALSERGNVDALLAEVRQRIERCHADAEKWLHG